MRKLIYATLTLAFLATIAAWPALAQEPEEGKPPAAPEEGIAEEEGRPGPPEKELKFKTHTAPHFRRPRLGLGPCDPDDPCLAGDPCGLHAPCDPIVVEGTPPVTHIRKELRILPLFGMLIPLSAILGGVAVIVVAILVGHHTARMRYEMISLAIKEGKEIGPHLLAAAAHRRRDPTLAGLVLTALGIALSVALGVVAGPAQAVWGLIPLLMGLALLSYGPLHRRLAKGREDKFD